MAAAAPVEVLVEDGVDDPTALLDAVTDGDVDRVRALLDAGAKLGDAVKLGVGTHELLLAVERCTDRHAEVVKLLLERGADPWVAAPRGTTALHYAIIRNSMPIVKLLLGTIPASEVAAAGAHAEAGVPPAVSAAIEGVNAANHLGDTPLIFASATGNPQIARLLLDHGADARRVNLEGCTPLHVLAFSKPSPVSAEIVQLLLDAAGSHVAAYINCQDNVGDTTLHHACRSGNVHVVQALAKCPALDITLRNTAGRTAFTALNDAAARGAPEARAKCKAIIQPLWDRVEAESAAKQRELLAELVGDDGSSPLVSPGGAGAVKAGHSKRRGKRKRGKRNRGKASKEAAASDASSRQVDAAAPVPVSSPELGSAAGAGVSSGLGSTGSTSTLVDATAAVVASSVHTSSAGVTAGLVTSSSAVLVAPFAHSQPPGLGPIPVPSILAPDLTGAQVDVTRAPPGLVPQSVALAALDAPTSPVAAGPLPGVPSVVAGGLARVHAHPVPPRPLPQHARGVGAPGVSGRDWTTVRGGVGAGVGAAAGAGPSKGAGSSSDDADASGSSSTSAGDEMLVSELTARLHTRFPKAEAVELHAEHMVGEGLGELSAGQLEVLQAVFIRSLEDIVDARIALGTRVEGDAARHRERLQSRFK